VAFGDPPNRFHPVAWMGGALQAGRRRFCRGSPTRLLAVGTGVTVGVAIAAAGAGWGVGLIAAALGPLGIVVEALALKTMLAARGLAAAAGDVASRLARGDVAAARAAVGWHLVSRTTATLDTVHVASATIESVAENLTDSVLAPLFFYALLGLPGAAAYRAINTADALLGYRDGPLEHFGKAAARLDDVLNFVPARLAALALVLAAGLSGGDARGAWTSLWRHHALTASPNAGWTMAAMAGALAVRLEKPGHYVLGDGRWPGVADVRSSVRVFWIATVIVVVLVASAVYLFA
jgi:adenosylcobinamide-phosphate synthase